jgi:hypothetical protein
MGNLLSILHRIQGITKEVINKRKFKEEARIDIENISKANVEYYSYNPDDWFQLVPCEKKGMEWIGTWQQGYWDFDPQRGSLNWWYIHAFAPATDGDDTFYVHVHAADKKTGKWRRVTGRWGKMVRNGKKYVWDGVDLTLHPHFHTPTTEASSQVSGLEGDAACIYNGPCRWTKDGRAYFESIYGRPFNGCSIEDIPKYTFYELNPPHPDIYVCRFPLNTISCACEGCNAVRAYRNLPWAYMKGSVALLEEFKRTSTPEELDNLRTMLLERCGWDPRAADTLSQVLTHR